MIMNISLLGQISVILVIFGRMNTFADAKGFDPNGDRIDDDKLRVCIVEGRGTYKKAGIFCPQLENDSNIECVIGLDRLDCLRRIHKGSAHFGVFSSEDLVAAQWAGVEVLITSEMRFNNAPFQYEIVAIVANDADINSVHDLRNSRFCHPGHGLKNHWTDVLANYFESTLVARGCEDDLSLTESRIKASANFFGPSCKAGPWVPDPVQDAILKKRYPSLCEICYDPHLCAKSDKHWGRLGPLYCLTSGDGDVAWVRLDDARSHFGFSGLKAESDPSLYSYLCPDGHLQPMHANNPCVWVAQPWPAIAAKREYATQIRSILEQLTHNIGPSWQNALLSLLETYHVNVTSLDVTIPINDYLEQAVGFTSAYSFPSCNPPRSIVYCTTSLIQHNKCSWLQEASSVYGIEPNIQCIRTESVERCMDDTSHKTADVVLVDQDNRVTAEKRYNLKPILYEFSKKLHERYAVIAVVKTNLDVSNFLDLRGKRACFPSYEGAAYLSALETIQQKVIDTEPRQCTLPNKIGDFFADDSCIWGPGRMGNCSQQYRGDEGALRCLVENRGDVAFMSMDVFKNFTSGQLTADWARAVQSNNFKLICPFGHNPKSDDLCYLNWTPRGHLMINNQTKLVRRNEIYNSLRDMDRLFGKNYESHTIPFTMFGPFDKKNNVMFRDQTEGLRGLIELEKDRSPRLLDTMYTTYASERDCSSQNGAATSFINQREQSMGIVLLLSIIYVFLNSRSSLVTILT